MGLNVQQAISRCVAGLCLLFTLGMLCFVVTANADLSVPPQLVAHVKDETGTLSDAQIATLESALTSLEREKGAQVAVLIVKTTESEPIEGFALRVVEKNRLGRRNVDDGILLLIAKDDRAVRIEVGYGLEGVVSDVIAKRIIEEQILPRFRSGDFFGGISAGVESISALIKGEALPPPAQRSSSRKNSISDLFFVAAFLCIGIGGALKASIGAVPGSMVGGLLCGLVGLLASGIGLGVVLAMIGFIFTLLAGIPARGYGSHGGWRSGGWSGGGGGWSGGGGSFGGGGASGRW